MMLNAKAPTPGPLGPRLAFRCGERDAVNVHDCGALRQLVAGVSSFSEQLHSSHQSRRDAGLAVRLRSDGAGRSLGLADVSRSAARSFLEARASSRKEGSMGILWIILIVVLVLALLGFFGFRR